MKRTKISFVGEKPIFTGSPQIVPGGFNLDREKQRFSVGDIIPAGTLAIFDEVTRKVQIVKTAKVKAIGTKDKKVPLTDLACNSLSPTEKPGVSNAPYVITLSAEISGLAVDDVLVEVVESSTNAAVIGEPNSLTIEEVTVKEFETAIDVTEDTMQYAVMERRVLPIPDSMKDSTKRYLKANSHIRFRKLIKRRC